MTHSTLVGPAASGTGENAISRIAFAFAVLPFLGTLAIDRDRLAPLALLPALWLGCSPWRRDRTPSASEGVDRLLLLVAAAVSLIASLLSKHWAPALVSLASWTWIVAGALLVRQLARNTRSIRCILVGITAGATLGCLAVWTQWTDHTPISAFPFYSHGRLFGLHMMIGTMTGLILLVESHGRRIYRVITALVVVINCGAMLWAGGRAPIVGVAVALALWLWRSSSGERRILLRSVLIVVAGGVIISLLEWSPQPYLGWWSAIERSTAAKTVSELSSTRLDFWHATWSEFLKAPWIGHGADSYRFITPKLDGDQPHNWILQFLLDFGLIGGVALAILLVRQAFRGIVVPPRPRNPELTTQNPDPRSSVAEFGPASPVNDSDPAGIRRGIAAAFVACLVAGLLDGIFYHAVLLLPAALLGGIAGSPQHSGAASSREPASDRDLKPLLHSTLTLLWPFCLGLATLILAVHSFLYLHLTRLPVPAGPDAPAAKLLRSFPSTTIGLERWLDEWKPVYENATLEWTFWAQHHDDNPAQFHVYAAIMYANRDDFVAADREMERAISTVHWTHRENLERFRRSIQKAHTTVRPSETKL